MFLELASGIKKHLTMCIHFHIDNMSSHCAQNAILQNVYILENGSIRSWKETPMMVALFALEGEFWFYSHNTQYVQNKTTIHLASTTTYKIYNIHKLHQSAPPQASGRQDPRGCPLRGWPHARHRGAARTSLREWNIPLPYMGPSTVLNAVTRARRPLRCVCSNCIKLQCHTSSVVV